MSIVENFKNFIWKRFVDKRDPRARAVTAYRAQVQCKGKEDQCYLWDISMNGVGLLVDKGSSFATDDEVTVTFPLESGAKKIVRTGQVKTIKIYHPKFSHEPLHQLRCSIKFHEPLSKNEADSISVESHIIPDGQAI